MATNEGISATNPYKRKVDLYAILGVDKGATSSQITKAYRALALRYHPDRNVGENSEEAAEKFKEISTAYAILSDPNKRRQYDLSGADAATMFENGMESVDLENLNSMMRVFGAMMTKLGVPIPTQIGASTLISAQEICKHGSILPGDPRVGELSLGHKGVSGKTERQEGAFYRIRLTEAEAANGVIFSCCSPNKSRFKLVVFDSNGGGVRYVQESAPTGDKKFTTATMYLVPFETITSFGPATPPLSDEPAVFLRLNTLTAESRSLQAGEHLVCVYGDNWLQRTQYCLTALLAELSPAVVKAVTDCDERIRAKKQELDALQDEYMAAKEKFEQVKAKVEEETAKTEALLQEREAAYNAFIEESLRRHINGLPAPSTAAAAAAATASIAAAVATAATAATATAAAATEPGELSTSTHSSPLSEHGKDSKTTPSAAAAAAGATAAATTTSSTSSSSSASNGTSTPAPGSTSPSKRPFSSFFASFLPASAKAGNSGSSKH